VVLILAQVQRGAVPEAGGAVDAQKLDAITLVHRFSVPSSRWCGKRKCLGTEFRRLRRTPPRNTEFGRNSPRIFAMP
jgi:hypothetical protein